MPVHHTLVTSCQHIGFCVLKYNYILIKLFLIRFGVDRPVGKRHFIGTESDYYEIFYMPKNYKIYLSA